MIPFIDLARDNKFIMQKLERATLKVLSSGNYILGMEVRKFEKEFSSFIDMKFGSAVSSGTSALHLTMSALGIKKGDEVITVPNTALPTILAISHSGAKPKFVDVEENSFLINPKNIEKAITKKTKAIIPVHLYGQCCEMDEITEIAEKHHIPVIEDACQAHGAEFKRKKAGSFSKISCFSFYPTKPLSAFGDAGMVLSNNKELIEKINILKNLGQEKKYDHKIIGYNSRMDEIQAAVLRIKLRYLNKLNKKRRKVAELYKECLSKNDKITLPEELPKRKHAWHLFVIRHKKRDRLIKHLKNNRINALIHYPKPVYSQKAYKFLKIKKSMFPVTEKLSKEIISLPFFASMDESEVKIVSKVINSFK